MSSPCSLAQEGGCSAPSYSAGERSATSSAKGTARRSSKRAFETAYLIVPRSSGTSERFSETDGPTATEAWSMWLRRAFHASPSALPGSVRLAETSATSGPRRPKFSSGSSHLSPCSKTCPACSQLDLLTGGTTSEPCSVTWPRSGSMRSGVVAERMMLAPRTSASGSGFWPTPQGRDHKSGRAVQDYGNARPLSEAVHKAPYPTPSATAYGSSGNGGGNNVASRGRPSLARMFIPTPTAGDAKSAGSRCAPGSAAHPGVSLTDYVRGDGGRGRTWTTPTARDRHTAAKTRRGAGSLALGQERVKPLVQQAVEAERTDYNKVAGEMRARAIASGGSATPPRSGLSLNPSWVEWLMGWPIGWTDCAPLATDKFRRWWSAHGKS